MQLQAAAETIASGLSAGLDAQTIRAHVAGILGSAQFAGAPRLAKFLSFVVETVLAGHGEQIKESLIAVEVYGRRPDYNPQIDSTVRVEAGRLRNRLKQYYETTGADERLEVELPKGTYVPRFRSRNPRAAEPAPTLTAEFESECPPECAPQVAEASADRPRALVRRVARGAAALAVVVSAAALSGGSVHKLGSAAPEAGSRSLRDTAVADAKTMELYLRAYELLRLPVLRNGPVEAVPPTVFESVRLFEEATRRSPRFAMAWAGLAEANEWLYELDKHLPPERLRAAKAAARRAIELDPDLPEAWTILTSILFFREWDIPAAFEACRRAIELNPRDALAQQRHVDLLRIQGRTDEAMKEVSRAAGVQPAAANLRNRKAVLLLDSGRFEEALREAQTAESLNPSRQQMAYTMSLWIQATVHQRQGRLAEAEKIYRKAIRYQPHDRWSEPALAYLMAVTGRRAEALELLAELRRQLALGRPRQQAIAVVYMGLGEHDEAMSWLERAFIDRDASVLFAPLDWRFAPLRSTARFDALVSRIRRTAASTAGA